MVSSFDPAAHLHKQGWKGKGTALKQGHATRPLAVVQKRNLGGIGRDRDEAVPFWDQIFAATAASIFSPTPSAPGSGTSTPLPSHTAHSTTRSWTTTTFDNPGTSNSNLLVVRPKEKGVPSTQARVGKEMARRGLYSRFLRGKTIVVEPEEEEEVESKTDLDAGAGPSTSLSASSSNTPKTADDVIESEAGMDKKGKQREREGETKEERKARRAAKASKKAEKEAKRALRLVKTTDVPGGSEEEESTGERKKKKRKDRLDPTDSVTSTPGEKSEKKEKRRKSDKVEPVPVNTSTTAEDGGSATKSKKKEKKRRTESSGDLIEDKTGTPREDGSDLQSKKKRRKEKESGTA